MFHTEYAISVNINTFPVLVIRESAYLESVILFFMCFLNLIINLFLCGGIMEPKSKLQFCQHHVYGWKYADPNYLDHHNFLMSDKILSCTNL